MTRPFPASRGGRHQTAAAVLCVVTLALAGCSGTPTASPSGSAATPPVTAATGGASEAVEIDPQLLEPLTALGPCTAEPKPLDEEPAAGATFPADTVLTSQDSNGPLTSIKGYIPMTPVQIRVYYQRHEDYDVVQVEDEIRESEALLTDGEHRFFVKAQAICEEGSVFLAVVAPEAAGEQVPVPAGAGN